MTAPDARNPSSSAARAQSAEREAHRRFLDRYYGWSRSIYDATRWFFLFGRDRALSHLQASAWSSLVEVGLGTGRNLRVLHRMRPQARFAGFDASEAMLEYARMRCPFARLARAFAEDADYTALLGEPPDRILFSYCLSMVKDPETAIAHARRSLSEGGEIVVVDFGDARSLPRPLRGALQGWLRRFHVKPLSPRLLEPHAKTLHFGRGRYWVMATIAASRTQGPGSTVSARKHENT